MRVMLVLVAALCTACTAAADAPKISHSPRELGRVILREISVDGGRVVLRTDSNGCSQKTSFKVQVRKEDGFSAGIPHYGCRSTGYWSMNARRSSGMAFGSSSTL